MISRRAVLLAALALPVAAHAQTTPETFALMVALGAEARTLKPEVYDPSYVKLAYPMGDVADDRGVCADVVIRAFRAAGVDLQKLVHEDMASAFSVYPKNWGLKRPDTNIDHRRVPNLEKFFSRAGASLPRSENPADFQPGDAVSWRIPGNLPHIGIVSTRKTETGTPLMVHNIGAGSQLEDVLFAWAHTGWFRYRPVA
jgi:uncharacterized protein